MTPSKLTKRHLNYLLEFKKKRKCGDIYSADTDIRKLLRLQDGNYTFMFTLLILFSVLRAGSLVSKDLPLIPTMIVFLCVGLFLVYRGYWINRSILFMINSKIFNLEESAEFNAEQVAASDR